MHFAAYAYVGDSVENPLLYYQNNVAATAAFLQTQLSNYTCRLLVDVRDLWRSRNRSDFEGPSVASAARPRLRRDRPIALGSIAPAPSVARAERVGVTCPVRRAAPRPVGSIQ
jgi:hypothetical protein